MTGETIEENINKVIWKPCTKDEIDCRWIVEIWLVSAVIYVTVSGIYESF